MSRGRHHAQEKFGGFSFYSAAQNRLFTFELCQVKHYYNARFRDALCFRDRRERTDGRVSRIKKETVVRRQNLIHINWCCGQYDKHFMHARRHKVSHFAQGLVCHLRVSMAVSSLRGLIGVCCCCGTKLHDPSRQQSSAPHHGSTEQYLECTFPSPS